MKLVECVPNFSEGRRPEVVRAIRDAIAAVEGVIVLDTSSDASHNRSVITFVAPLESAVDAAFAGIRDAREHIDLRTHKGEHPRIGATDVVPFVPLESSTMDDCVTLARQLGERVGRELDIPVYLYERAATRPTRENLADVRRGEFEGLLAEVGTNAERDPDFGPRRVHPSAGAVAIGARPFLVAYNIYLGDAGNLPVAKKIAKAIRTSSGGLPYVKALGLEVDGQAQVSINLTDVTQTSMHMVFDAVQAHAANNGVSVTWSEIVGLVPERALFDAAASHLKLKQFTPDQILERRVRDAMTDRQSLRTFLASVASSSPTPGGGSAAAHAGALAASLVQMVANLTLRKKRYAAVEAEMGRIGTAAADLGSHLSSLVQRDAEAYGKVSATYKLPRESPADERARSTAIGEALLGAAAVPLETARACAAVAELALDVAERGNSNAITDAGVAALLAEAGCNAAAYNVKVNVAALERPQDGAALARECEALVSRTAGAAAKARALTQRSFGA